MPDPGSDNQKPVRLDSEQTDEELASEETAEALAGDGDEEPALTEVDEDDDFDPGENLFDEIITNQGYGVPSHQATSDPLSDAPVGQPRDNGDTEVEVSSGGGNTVTAAMLALQGLTALAAVVSQGSGEGSTEDSRQTRGESHSERLEVKTEIGSRVTIDGRPAIIAGRTEDGKFITRLTDVYNDVTPDMTQKVGSEFSRLEAAGGENGERYYIRPPQDPTSALEAGEFRFLKTLETEHGTMIQDASKEFTIVEQSQLGPEKSILENERRRQAISRLEIQARDQVVIGERWGEVVGITSDNRLVVDLAHVQDHSTGLDAPGVEELRRRGYEPVRLDIAEGNEGRRYFFRPSVDPTSIHAAEEIAVIERGMMTNPDNLVVVDPESARMLKHNGELGETSRTARSVDLSVRRGETRSVDFTYRNYADGASIGVPATVPDSIYANPRDIRLYSIDGGETHTLLYRRGPWFHFDSKGGQGGRSKVHVTVTNSTDAAVVDKALIPLLGEALSGNPQSREAIELAALIVDAKMKDPLNRDSAYLDESIDRELKLISRDRDGSLQYREFHVGPEGQNSKQYTIYTRNTADARRVGELVDSFLSRQSAESPNIVLDADTRTGQVGDRLRLPGVNRVSVARDAWPLVPIYDSTYPDAAYDKYTTLDHDTGKFVEHRSDSAIGASIEEDLGKQIRDRVRDVYGKDGPVTQEDLNRLCKETGIREGFVTILRDGTLAVHATQSDDLSRSNAAYMADGIAKPGDLTGRHAMYRLYDFLNQGGPPENRDPLTYLERAEQAERRPSDNIPPASRETSDAERIKQLNERLAEMAATRFGELTGEDRVRFMSEFERSLERAATLYGNEIQSTNRDIDPNMRMRLALDLSIVASETGQPVADILEQLKAARGETGPGREVSDFLSRLEGKPAFGFVTSDLESQLERTMSRAALGQRDAQFQSTAVTPSEFIRTFIDATSTETFENLHKTTAERASMAVTNALRKSLRNLDGPALRSAPEVRFDSSLSSPRLVFESSQGAVDVVGMRGDKFIDSSGREVPSRDINVRIDLPDSLRTDPDSKSRISEAVFEQLTRMRIITSGAANALGVPIDTALSGEEGRSKLRQAEQVILEGSLERYGEHQVIDGINRRLMEQLRESAFAELRRHGLSEHYLSDGLLEIVINDRNGEFERKSGDFSSEQYRIRIKPGTDNPTAVNRHEVKHLVQARDNSVLALAFGSDYREMVLESTLADVGRGGLVRTADGVEYRADLASQTSREEMRGLVRDFLSETDRSSSDLRSLSQADIREWLQGRTAEDGRIRGAGALQTELGAISNTSLAAALKTEVVHFAVTEYESTLPIEPPTNSKHRELVFQRSLDRVGSGGVRYSSTGGTEILSRHSNPEASNEMRMLLNDYVREHRTTELSTLRGFSTEEVSEWLQKRTSESGDLPRTRAIQAELGGVNEIARELAVEISNYANNALKPRTSTNIEVERSYQRMTMERSLAGVGMGGTRLTADGSANRPTYKNATAARDVRILVGQFMTDSQMDRLDLRTLTDAKVEQWLDARKENRPGSLLAEFNGDKQAAVRELRAEIVHAGLDYFQQSMQISRLPEPVFREILQEAIDLRNNVDIMRESGRIESVRDLPRVQHQMRNLSRDAIGRVYEPHYQFSIQEITARRVELRDMLHQEIWRGGLESAEVQATIEREGRQSEVAQRAIRQFGEGSPEARKAIFDEGIRSPTARRELIHAGMRSETAQSLVDQIKLDVKREMLDRELLLLETDPGNRESLTRARELAEMIVADLTSKGTVSSAGKNSIQFLLDMGLISPSDSRARSLDLSRGPEAVSFWERGSNLYDMQPIPEFGRINAVGGELRNVLYSLNSVRTRPDSAESKRMIERAGDMALRALTDPQLRVAETLGIPVQFLTRENFRFEDLGGIEGKEVLNRGETIIGIAAENPLFTAIHEAGHGMRMRRLMALAEADPAGVRLAVMDHCLDGIGRPGKIVTNPEGSTGDQSERGVVRERYDFKAPEAEDLFREHLRKRMLESLRKSGFAVGTDTAVETRFEPALLNEFNGNREALETALRHEVENFERLTDLLDTSKLNESSRRMVQFLRNGPAGQVVHLAADNLVEQTGRQIDPATDMAALQREIAHLTATEQGNAETGLKASEDFIRKVLQDNPVDMTARQVRSTIREMASESQATVRETLADRTVNDLLLIAARNLQTENSRDLRPRSDVLKLQREVALLTASQAGNPDSGVRVSTEAVNDFLSRYSTDNGTGIDSARLDADIGKVSRELTAANRRFFAMVGESRGNLSLRGLRERLGESLRDVPDNRLSRSLIDYQNGIHERVLDQAGEHARQYRQRGRHLEQTIEFARERGIDAVSVRAPYQVLEPPKIDGRTNPVVQKMIRTFGFDQVAREAGGSSVEYRLSADEQSAGRRSDIATRAKLIHRELGSGDLPAEEAARLREQHRQLVDYLTLASREERMNRAIINGDTREANRLARQILPELARDVEINKPVIEYILENCNLHQADLRGTPLEGFFNPEGRARTVIMERLRNFTISDNVISSTVQSSDFDPSMRERVLREPVEIRDTRGARVRVVSILESQSGELSLRVTMRDGLIEDSLEVKRVWPEFEKDFSNSYDERLPNIERQRANALGEYISLLHSEQQSGRVYETATGRERREVQEANDRFKSLVFDEVQALENKTYDTLYSERNGSWSEARTAAEQALERSGQRAAERLGFYVRDTDGSIRHIVTSSNIISEIAHDRGGSYGDGFIRISILGSNPVNTLEHEILHFQESMMRTALSQADPELFRRLVLEDCLQHVGRGGRRMVMRQVEPRAVIENSNARAELQRLVRSFVQTGESHATRLEITEWLKSQSVAPELVTELKGMRNVAIEVHAEAAHFSSTLSNSTTNAQRLNEAGKEYLRQQTERLRAMVEAGTLESSPEVEKLMRSISNDTVGRSYKPNYQFSIEEIRARRFQLTRELSRIGERNRQGREALLESHPYARRVFNEIRIGNLQEHVLEQMHLARKGDNAAQRIGEAQKASMEILKLLPTNNEHSNHAVRYMLEHGLITIEAAQEHSFGGAVTSFAVGENQLDPMALAEQRYNMAHSDAAMETIASLRRGELATDLLRPPVDLEGGGREFRFERPLRVNFGPQMVVEISSIVEKDGEIRFDLKYPDGKSFPETESRSKLFMLLQGHLDRSPSITVTPEQRPYMVAHHLKNLETLAGLSPEFLEAALPAQSTDVSREATEVRTSRSTDTGLAVGRYTDGLMLRIGDLTMEVMPGKKAKVVGRAGDLAHDRLNVDVGMDERGRLYLKKQFGTSFLTIDGEESRAWNTAEPGERVYIEKPTSEIKLNGIELAFARTEVPDFSHIERAQVAPDAPQSERAIEQGRLLIERGHIPGAERLVDGFTFAETYRGTDGTNIIRTPIVVDPAHDTILRDILTDAEKRFGQITDQRAKMEAITRYVHDLLTPERIEPPPGWRESHPHETFSIDRAEELMDEQFRRRTASGETSQKVYLGECIRRGIGTCVPQSLLVKAIGDHMGLNVGVQLGTYGEQNHALNSLDTRSGEIYFDPRVGIYDGKEAASLPGDYTLRSRDSSPHLSPELLEQLRSLDTERRDLYMEGIRRNLLRADVVELMLFQPMQESGQTGRAEQVLEKILEGDRLEYSEREFRKLIVELAQGRELHEIHLNPDLSPSEGEQRSLGDRIAALEEGTLRTRLLRAAGQSESTEVRRLLENMMTLIENRESIAEFERLLRRPHRLEAEVDRSLRNIETRLDNLDLPVSGDDARARRSRQLRTAADIVSSSRHSQIEGLSINGPALGDICLTVRSVGADGVIQERPTRLLDINGQMLADKLESLNPRELEKKIELARDRLREARESKDSRRIRLEQQRLEGLERLSELKTQYDTRLAEVRAGGSIEIRQARLEFCESRLSELRSCGNRSRIGEIAGKASMVTGLLLLFNAFSPEAEARVLDYDRVRPGSR